MLRCKPTLTLMKLKTKVGIDEGSQLIDRGQFQRLVERLTYLSHTRLDITYEVGKVSQFLQSPRAAHE